MNWANVMQLISIISPVLVAGITGGGIVAWIQYKSKKAEAEANARKVNISSEITVGEAWQRYAEKQEVIVTNLLQKHENLEQKYDKEIALKDEIIRGLKKEIELKAETIARLEKELQSRVMITVAPVPPPIIIK